MFRKRIKKTFPEGTFIPTRPRILAIIQLCLAFSAFLFLAAKPFMAEHFNLKSQILLYDDVMGKNEPSKNQLFHQLPVERQTSIIQNYEALSLAVNTSFVDKIKKSFDTILFRTPLFERMWIIFAIIIPILLLKKTEGATHAAWVLPLIVTAYFISNELKPDTPYLNEAEKLFPKEELLVNKYLKKNIHSLSFSEQQKELLRAWHLYLIEDFAKEDPAKDLKRFEKQILKGEFAFNVARVERLPMPHSLKDASEKQPKVLMMLYLIWNVLFAFEMSTSKYRLKLLQKNQEERVG